MGGRESKIYCLINSFHLQKKKKRTEAREITACFRQKLNRILVEHSEIIRAELLFSLCIIILSKKHKIKLCAVYPFIKIIEKTIDAHI